MIWSPATVTPLLCWLSTKPQLDWSPQEGFPYKQIEEHKQERVNSQYEIADVYEVNMSTGFESDLVP